MLNNKLISYTNNGEDMKNNDIKYYSLDRRTPTSNEHLGKTRYSQQAIKKINRNKKITLNKKGAIAILIVTMATGFTAHMGFEKTVDFVAQQRIENAAYKEAQKPVAFTNYSDMQISTMDLESRIELYKSYASYVDTHAQLPYTYEVQGLPDNLNYSKALYKANEAYELYKSTYANSLNEQQRYEALKQIMQKYMLVVNIINSVYEGHYAVNVENADDSYKLINQVNEQASRTL